MYTNRLPDVINCSKKENNFTIVNNNLLRNPDLSFKSKGVLCLLLSNSTGWKSYLETICSMSTDGTSSIKSALSELEEKGFLLRVRYVNKITKQIAGSFWAYTDTPYNFNMDIVLDWLERNNYELRKDKLPQAEKPQAENPPVGNRSLRISNGKKVELKEEEINPLTPLPTKSTINRRNRTLPQQPPLPFKRPARPVTPFLKLFPEKYHTNKDFQFIWKEYVEYRGENKKHPLTERAVKLMLSEITSNPALTPVEAVERVSWCIKMDRIAPNFKPFRNNKSNRKGDCNNDLDPNRFDNVKVEER